MMRASRTLSVPAIALGAYLAFLLMRYFYPHIAVLAKLSGVVILEATVGVDGGVMSTRVLQSRGPLDKAALDAVKRWQYSPLVLNGIPTPFVLTVTLNFSLARS